MRIKKLWIKMRGQHKMLRYVMLCYGLQSSFCEKREPSIHQHSTTESSFSLGIPMKIANPLPDGLFCSSSISKYHINYPVPKVNC